MPSTSRRKDSLSLTTQNDRMTFADQGLLVLRQPGQEREFLALYRRLDAAVSAGCLHRHQFSVGQVPSVFAALLIAGKP